MNPVETIIAGTTTLAVIVRHSINAAGVTFFTPSDFSQQLAYMQHGTGKVIVPHVHKAMPRAVTKTLEVLVVRKGRLRVDLYEENLRYVESRILGAGDVILLVAGGHGFEVLETVEMFEVKQGPFAGEEDKVRFEGIGPAALRITGGES